jgi:hypothetical protein
MGLEVEEVGGAIPNGDHDPPSAISPVTVRPCGPDEPIPSPAGLSDVERWKLLYSMVGRAVRTSDRAEAYAEAANENTARSVRALVALEVASKDQSELLGRIMASNTRLEVRVGTVERDGQRREGSHPALEKLINIGLHETESVLRGVEEERKAVALRKARIWGIVIKWAAAAGPFVGAGIYAAWKAFFGG